VSQHLLFVSTTKEQKDMIGDETPNIITREKGLKHTYHSFLEILESVSLHRKLLEPTCLIGAPPKNSNPSV
jgi:hypothetical protein